MEKFGIHKRKPQDATQFMTAGTQKYSMSLVWTKFG